MKTMWTKEFSKQYHHGELIEKEYILTPAIKAVLKQKRWKRLIDLGCGSGYYCRMFAGKNAEIIGVDKSKTQLDIARHAEQKKRLGIKYIQSDLQHLKSVESNTIDVALLNFVIVEIADKKRIQNIFKEAWRILEHDGILIIGQTHPHNINRKNSINDRTFLEKKNSYFTNSSPAISKALLTNGKYLIFNNNYHYTLEFILNELSKAGFILESLKELSYKEQFPTHILIVEKKGKRL